MNYLQQLNRFYQQLPTAGLSSQAICLYGVLLHVNNQCYWRREFTVSNGTLMGLCHLTERALRYARAMLVEGGWITYAGQRGQQAGVYTICRLQAYERRREGGETAEEPTREPTQAGADLHAYNKENTKKTFPPTPQGGRARAERQKNPALRYTQRTPEELAQYDDGILWF